MTTAWVTLATNDGYAIGALVLAQSIRQTGTIHKLHVLYTPGVTAPVLAQLQATFDDSTLVDVLDSGDAENLAIIGRPDLGVTFTKLQCWRLTQYTKAVFLDADVLVLQNADELFDRPEFAAAPDIGWPDFFNSGVFVFVPNLETYRALLQFALDNGTFDGGDQGLLNRYFSDWRELPASHRLPFTYNMTSGVIYSYAAALKHFGANIKIVHFIGKTKPWLKAGEHQHSGQHWDQWQRLYQTAVAKQLPKNLNPAYICSDDPYVASVAWQRTSVGLVPVPASQVIAHATPRPYPLVQQQQHHHHHHHHQQQHHHQPPPPPPVADPSSSHPPPPPPPSSAPPPTVHYQPPESPLSDSSESEYESDSEAELSQEERFNAWDQGAPDYSGRDSFANIQKHIESVLNESLEAAAAQKAEATGTADPTAASPEAPPTA